VCHYVSWQSGGVVQSRVSSGVGRSWLSRFLAHFFPSWRLPPARMPSKTSPTRRSFWMKRCPTRTGVPPRRYFKRLRWQLGTSESLWLLCLLSLRAHSSRQCPSPHGQPRVPYHHEGGLGKPEPRWKELEENFQGARFVVPPGCLYFREGRGKVSRVTQGSCHRCCLFRVSCC
jgi:hypothetical protein